MAVIKGCKSIAEYQIRKYLIDHGLMLDHCSLTMNGREATVVDQNGDTLKLTYDGKTREVCVEGDY